MVYHFAWMVLGCSTSLNLYTCAFIYHLINFYIPSLFFQPVHTYLDVSAATLCGQVSKKLNFRKKAVFSNHVDKSCTFSKKHAFAQLSNASELIVVTNTDNTLVSYLRWPTRLRKYMPQLVLNPLVLLENALQHQILLSNTR